MDSKLIQKTEKYLKEVDPLPSLDESQFKRTMDFFEKDELFERDCIESSLFHKRLAYQIYFGRIVLGYNALLDKSYNKTYVYSKITEGLFFSLWSVSKVNFAGERFPKKELETFACLKQDKILEFLFKLAFCFKTECAMDKDRMRFYFQDFCLSLFEKSYDDNTLCEEFDTFINHIENTPSFVKTDDGNYSFITRGMMDYMTGIYILESGKDEDSLGEWTKKTLPSYLQNFKKWRDVILHVVCQMPSRYLLQATEIILLEGARERAELVREILTQTERSICLEYPDPSDLTKVNVSQSKQKRLEKVENLIDNILG